MSTESVEQLLILEKAKAEALMILERAKSEAIKILGEAKVDADLTLEKARVVQRLEGLELAVNTLVTEGRLKTENDKPIILAMQANMELLNHVVNGNGKVGLSEKVRSLEGVVKSVRWMWIAIIGFTVTTLRDWIMLHR